MGRREDRQWGGRGGLTIPMRYRERLKDMQIDRHQILGLLLEPYAGNPKA